MAKPIKKSHRRKASAPPELARRVARRRATADRRLRILERLPGLAVEPFARGGGTAPRRREIIARMRSAGRLRLRRLPIITESIGRIHPSPSLRGALETKQSRGRVMRPRDCFAALAMTAGPRRELPAPNSAPAEAGDENFPGCKALKSHEMKLESVDVTKTWDQRSFVRGAGRLGRAYRADRDRRARRRREASPKPLRSRLIVHLLNRGVSAAGIAAREGPGAKRSRSEMAP
jgi:hypothetical protein